MKLLDSLGLTSLASSAILNLENLFGIPGDLYFPKVYEDSRGKSGDIIYDIEPSLSRQFLFSNYIQEVTPSMKFKEHDIRTEILEAYVPYTEEWSSVPKQSKLILNTTHGKETYILTDIVTLAGNKECYFLKMYFTPFSDYYINEEEVEDLKDLEDEINDIKQDMNIISDTKTSENIDIDLQQTDMKTNQFKYINNRYSKVDLSNTKSSKSKFILDQE